MSINRNELHTCPACKDPSWDWIEVSGIKIENHKSICCPNCGVIISIPIRKPISQGYVRRKAEQEQKEAD